MDKKIIEINENLLTLYKSIVPNIVELLGIDEVKDLDINKSSIANYISYLEVCFAYENGIIDYNTFVNIRELALQDKLIECEPKDMEDNDFNLQNYILKLLHLGYTLDAHIMFLDEDFKNHPLMERKIRQVTTDTISYNKDYLFYYLSLIRDTNYRDGASLDYLCSQILELYSNLFGVRVNDIVHPLLSYTYDWTDIHYSEVQLDAYVLVGFGIDVYRTLNKNLDKVYLKEIKEELKTIFTKHRLLYTIVYNNLETGDIIDSYGIPEFYNKCIKELNNNKIIKLNTF